MHHRLSSAYHPHSNQRAELAVKTAKRLIRENVDKSGKLNNDKFSRALLNYRNTPCRDINLSPAQIVFGRKLRDFIPCRPGEYKPRPEWILTRENREQALSRRYEMMGQRLKFGTKTLHKLDIGDIVSVQNQTGPRAKKWDKTGVIVEVLPFDQYNIKMDGSGQVTLRNRQFIRKLSSGPNTETRQDETRQNETTQVRTDTSSPSARATSSSTGASTPSSRATSVIPGQTKKSTEDTVTDQVTQPLQVKVVCEHLQCGPPGPPRGGRRGRGVRDTAASHRRHKS